MLPVLQELSQMGLELVLLPLDRCECQGGTPELHVKKGREFHLVDLPQYASREVIQQFVRGLSSHPKQEAPLWFE